MKAAATRWVERLIKLTGANMRSSFPNPWAEVIIEQMGIVRQSTNVVARCIDPELLLDPQAVVEYRLHPSAERLNPLEFHGKRRRNAVSRHTHP